MFEPDNIINRSVKLFNSLIRSTAPAPHEARVKGELGSTRQNSAELGGPMPATLEHGAQLTANLGRTQQNSVGQCANNSRARQNSAELGGPKPTTLERCVRT